MSRITGSEVANLMEAYNAVYAPQINEDQIQENFEIWMNSLVEEGYDLSKFTWEEMYEEYITEIGINLGGLSTKLGGLAAKINLGGQKTAKPSTGVSGLSAADRAAYSAGGGNAKAQQGMGMSTAQVIARGKTNLGRMDQGKPAAAKPAPAAAAKPAAAPATASKPAPAATPAAKAAPAAAAPKKPSLASGIDDLKKMGDASRQRQGLTQSFDPFDVVLGHLIDEGYADTEEAALQIMANMSEEWREEILEADNIGSRLWNAAAKGFTGYGTPDNDWVAKGVNMAARSTFPGMVATGARALAGAPKAISAAQRTYNPPTSRPATPAPATPTRPATPASNSGGSPAPARPTPTASSTVLAKQGGVEGRLDKSTGKFTAGKFSDAESSRYSSRTATQTPKTSPTSTTPSTGPKINQDVADLRRMQSASLMRQQNRNLPNGKIPTSNDLDAQKVAGKAATPVASTGAAPEVKQTAAIAAAPRPITPNPSAPGAGKEDMMKKQLNQHFDPFDSILEYLVAEGYADTNNAAIKIMANMSEEWRESVLESFASRSVIQQIRQQAAERDQRLKDQGKTSPAPQSTSGTAPSRPGGSRLIVR